MPSARTLRLPPGRRLRPSQADGPLDPSGPQERLIPPTGTPALRRGPGIHRDAPCPGAPPLTAETRPAPLPHASAGAPRPWAASPWAHGSGVSRPTRVLPSYDSWVLPEPRARRGGPLKTPVYNTRPRTPPRSPVSTNSEDGGRPKTGSTGAGVPHNFSGVWLSCLSPSISLCSPRGAWQSRGRSHRSATF